MANIAFIRRIPGFRTKTWWKMIIAGIGYLFLLLFILLLLFPSPPTLALEESKPTSQSSVPIKGKTRSNVPVYLIRGEETVQTLTTDSNGGFYLLAEDLEEGEHPFKVEVCSSSEREKCTSQTILLVVDKTPPAKPVVTIPSVLPEIEGEKVTVNGTAELGCHISVSQNGEEVAGALVGEDERFTVDLTLSEGKNLLAFTAVDEAGNESEAVLQELSFVPVKQKATVVRVIDGDTIELEGGSRLRYIGIDTPETLDPNRSDGCFGKEASQRNKELVEGREVLLEKDVSETDRFGRLLRYVYLGDEMVNETLVREGYAKASSYPPDVKYQERFRQAEQEARQQQIGLWGEACLPQPTPTPVFTPFPTPLPTVPDTLKNQPSLMQEESDTPSQPKTPSFTSQPFIPQTPVVTPPPNTGTFGCDCSKLCTQMSSCEEAYFQLNQCGCEARDGNNDGVPCESICE